MKWLMMMVMAVGLAAADLSVHVEKTFTAGADDVLFAELTAVCAAPDGSLLILDRRSGRVVRFSAQGDLLGKFGARGRGPGEFAYPGSMACTRDGRVVVCEDQIFVSFFTPQGRFINRLRVEKGLGLEYLSDDLYYAWHWEPGIKQQIIVDAAGVVRKTLYDIAVEDFSVSLPGETGRLVMSNFQSPLYTPRFLFARDADGCAAARSDRYEIRLMDLEGKEIRLVSRKVDPIPITPKEHERAAAEITRSRSLHDKTRKVFIKRIPRHRNFFAGLVLTPDHLLAVRLHEDPWLETGPVPVDVFTRAGDFLGSIKLPGEPLWADRERMLLCVPGDEPMVGMYKYQLKLKSWREGDRYQ